MSNIPEAIYPAWKKVAWKVARFLGDIIAGALTTEVLMVALNLDPKEGMQYVAYVCVGAVFSAVAKYAREKATSYNALSHKLPL